MSNGTNDMQLGVGEMLQLVFAADDNRRKHPTRVIGYLPGKSLLVTTPRIDGRVMLVREGQPVVVRMLSGNSVYAFNTQILATSLKPFAYMHLTYPENIERIVVRKAMRVTADLETTITRITVDEAMADLVTKGVIKDISTTGAMLASDEVLGESGDLMTLTLRIHVAGVLKYLKLASVIRSVRESSSGVFMHGLEFQLLDEMDSILLHGYVYEQLQKQGAE